MRKLLSFILCMSIFAFICGCDNKPAAESTGTEASSSATESVMTNEELYNTVTSFADMYSKSFSVYVSNKIGKVETKTHKNVKTPSGKDSTAVFRISEDKAFETLVFEITEGDKMSFEEYDKFTDGSFFVTRSEFGSTDPEKTKEYWVADQKAFYIDREKKTAVEVNIADLGIYDNFEIIEQTYG